MITFAPRLQFNHLRHSFLQPCPRVFFRGDVLRLLHGSTEAELDNPLTYAEWIEWIKLDSSAIRTLVLWRLRIADPEFKPQTSTADTPDRQQKLSTEWKRRIPEGKLPPGRKLP